MTPEEWEEYETVMELQEERIREFSTQVPEHFEQPKLDTALMVDNLLKNYRGFLYWHVKSGQCNYLENETCECLPYRTKISRLEENHCPMSHE